MSDTDSFEEENVMLKKEIMELKQRIAYLETGDGYDHKVINKNKKTAEEKREAARIRKQESRQKQREKYGDEEYKKKLLLIELN